MLITRTPYRISFLGGGTDYPQWYLKNNGMVLSTTIDKYSYITLNNLDNFFKYKYRIRYYYREEKQSVSQIKHPTIKNTLKLFNIKNGLDIYHYGELPARTGIGSSSSFTVGLVHSLYKLLSKTLNKKNIMNDSIFIEQKLNQENIGSQDQVATCYGGFNCIKFEGKKILINNLKRYNKNISLLENSCLLFYSGKQRESSMITKNLIKKMRFNEKHFNNIKNLTKEGLEIIKSSNFKIGIFGDILREAWYSKNQISKKFTNNKINELFNDSINFGAKGFKMLGAGSEGFFIIIAEKKDHKKLINRYKNYLNVKINFENEGSKIIYEK
tara:strand:- start:1275 stop:2255 length:981 start_codon:yes stop_codon:yes gene_type:complete